MAQEAESVYSYYYTYLWEESMEAVAKRLRRGIPPAGWWWASLDWARGPFYYLIVIYVYSTYFAQSVVGDPVRGQALFSTTQMIAGFAMAMIAPFLGSYMDRGGRKKPVLAALMLALALSCVGLSFIHPETPYAIPLVMTLLALAGCCFSVSELFQNALLGVAGTKSEVSLISGLGLALSSAASVLLLLGVLYFTRYPPAGLAEVDVARLSGIVCAIWIAVFVWPFLCFMPDRPGAAGRWRGVSPFPRDIRLIVTVRALFAEWPQIMRFLIARMVFMDGLIALFAITAVYTSGTLGWTRAENAAMGIIVTIAAVGGGLAAGWLDRQLGPRNAIMTELLAITALFLLQISISRDAILFGLVPIAAQASERLMFAETTDVIFLISAIPMGAMIVAAYASCRSLLVMLSPSDRLGQFFGIYAMTSTITVWLGPALVALMTALSGSQRIGFGSLIVLFVIGCALMLRVDVTTPVADQNSS